MNPLLSPASDNYHSILYCHELSLWDLLMRQISYYPSLLVWLLSPNIMTSKLSQMTRFHPCWGAVPWTNSISWCVYVPFSLATHHLLHIVVASISWLLWTELQQTWECRSSLTDPSYLLELQSSNPTAPVLAFWGTSHCFPQWLY